MNQPAVFVVILNWNLKEDTISCVESVLAGSYAHQQVIVVDNGSQDGSASYRVQFYRHHYSFPSWIYLILSTPWVILRDLLRGDGQAALACARGFYCGWWPDVADEPV